MVMSPLHRAIEGGDQVKFTSLCPASAANISGAPDGAKNREKNK